MAREDHPDLTDEEYAVLADEADQVVQDVRADIQAQLDTLRAENARLRANQSRPGNGGLTLMVGKEGKGNISIYGLGRFPYSPYPEQILKILDMAPEIRAFVKTNHGVLSWKKGDPFA